MSWQLPTGIEEAGPTILDTLHEAVNVYRFLAKRYKDVDPGTDSVYQFVFRSFYRLDGAGLSREFKNRYFELMAEAKKSGEVDVRSVVMLLRPYPNLRGQETIQFSFATKLAATVKRVMPIYDAEIASVFGFRAPYNYKSFESRLEEYLDFYSGLTAFYQQILDADLLKEVREQFRERFDCLESDVSDFKVLDFIFWAAGKLSRETAQ